MAHPAPLVDSHQSAVPLQSIICTEELHRRPLRPPDYQKENRALVVLAHALNDSPHTILQTLADTILEVCQADSAGISLLTTNDGGKRFYWPAIAGRWKPHIGGGTPRDFGPCGDVLDHNIPLLFCHFERRYTYFQSVTPPVEECLLSPFYVKGKGVGTIWAIVHDDRRKFDAEDERLLSSLGKFASSAYQILRSLDALKFQMAEREKAEEQLRKLADGLETQVRVRTQELEQRNAEVLQQTEQLRELSNRLLQTQDEERRRIARELHDSTGQKIAVLRMDLARAQRQVGSLQEGAVLSECLSLATEISNEIRTLSYVLHPPMLDELGLISAIRVYVEGINKRRTLQVMLEVPSRLERLSEEVEITLFRVIQAALVNVQLHSGSKMATVRIAHDTHKLMLEIIDQGCGFTPEAIKKGDSMRASGVGLISMKERLRLIGGRLEIDTGNRGTILRGLVPISSSAAHAQPSGASNESVGSSS